MEWDAPDWLPEEQREALELGQTIENSLDEWIASMLKTHDSLNPLSLILILEEKAKELKKVRLQHHSEVESLTDES